MTRKLEVFDSRGNARKLEMTSGDLAVLAMFLDSKPETVFSNLDILQAVKRARTVPERKRKDKAEANINQIARRVVGRLRQCFVEAIATPSAQHQKTTRRHLLGSAGDPIKTEPQNGYTFRYRVVGPENEATRQKPEIRRTPQTVRKVPLRNLSALESAQCAVMAFDFVLNEDSLRKLSDLEDASWSHSHENGYYASLIIGFALLKGGPTVSLQNRKMFNKLMRFTRSPVAESMPAKWIAARAHLAWTSVLRDEVQLLKEKREAYDLFSGIEPISSNHFAMPLLLPGATQEFEPSKLEYIDRASTNDPLVREIVTPHRYIGSSAVILAEHLGMEGNDYLDESLRQCKEVEKRQPADSAPRLNADLLRIGTRALMHPSKDRRSNHANLVYVAGRLIERVTASARKGLISRYKEREWIANCHACSAAAIGRGHEYVEHIESLVHELGLLVDSLGHVPDFLHIDPIYKIAFEAQSTVQLSDVLRHLRIRKNRRSSGAHHL